MHVAIYGGSFHPPHVGHGMVAAWLHWTGRADAVWLLPTFRHAFDKPLAPFADRVRWCEAMASDVGPWVEVCTIERELPVPSYTIDTLDALSARYPQHAFRLVLGADNLPHTAKWKNWAGIQARYAPIVVGRDGYDNPPDTVVFPGVSSTEVRRRLAADESVEHLLSASVRAAMGLVDRG